MPRAKLNTNTVTTPEDDSEPTLPPNLHTSGYATRRKPYQYSNTKAPFLKPPPVDPEPPKIPSSAACKKPARGPKRKATSANSQVLDDMSSNSASQSMDNESHTETLTTQSSLASPNVGSSTLTSALEPLASANSAARTTIMPEFQEQRNHLNQEEFQSTANRIIPDLPYERTEPSPFRNQLPIEPIPPTESIPSVSPAPPFQTTITTQATFATQPTPRLSPMPHAQQTFHIQPAHFSQPTGPTMATPLRPNRGTAWDEGAPQVINPSIAISSPSPVVFRNPPAWALNFEDQVILNPNFNPNPTPQFDNPSIAHHSTAGALLSIGPQDLNISIAPGGSAAAASSFPRHDGYLAHDVYSPSFDNTYRERTVSPALPSQSLSIPGFGGVARRSISPAISPMSCIGAMYATTSSTSRGSTPQPSELAVLHARVARAFSTSPAPVPSRTSANIQHRPTTPANLGSEDAHSYPPKPASGFTYGQNEFIREMTRRWHWFLLAEDAFPVSLVRAQESAIVYAEGVLNASRAVEGLTKQHFDYVRKKDSRIRGDLKEGVREKVQAHYNIDQHSLALVKELIKSSNFIFTSYNPRDLKVVAGRYRHVCIIDVLTSILFPVRTRGTTIGVRFGQELIAMTPKEVLRGYQDQTATYGAPVAAIALACTLILHALHTLEQDIIAYNEGKPRPKAISFEERSYGVSYRGFVSALKGYKRLGELRRFHMHYLLREYTSRVKNTEMDENVDEDAIERCSDGE